MCPPDTAAFRAIRSIRERVGANLAEGGSPAAMPSVQSPNNCKPFSGPMRPSVSAMLVIACPD